MITFRPSYARKQSSGIFTSNVVIMANDEQFTITVSANSADELSAKIPTEVDRVIAEIADCEFARIIEKILAGTTKVDNGFMLSSIHLSALTHADLAQRMLSTFMSASAEDAMKIYDVVIKLNRSDIEAIAGTSIVDVDSKLADISAIKSLMSAYNGASNVQ